MIPSWLRVLSLSCLLVSLVGCGDVDPVTTSYGVINGRTDGEVRSWLGVPFAKPPLGELRWQAPQPPEPWSHSMEAIFSSNACIQGGQPTGAIGSSEDCLYLDIWAPTTPGPHPVMVWLHGGGLILGSGSELHYRGENLAKEQDVIVVSINYRLSFMGFLALPQLTQESGYNGSGNQGFLDQVQALKWVKEEIASFGGDPQNITVFGESGGAISTCTLMASPLTEGLFHKAIMQSGSCRSFGINSLAQAEQTGSNFLAKLGCADSPDPLGCARALSKQDILELVPIEDNELFLKPTEDWVFEPLPAIDNYVLPEHPIALLENDMREDLSILIGSNENEGTLFVFARDHANNEQEYLDYMDFWYPGLANDIAEVYPMYDYPNAGEAAAAAAGDAFLTCPAREIADIVADAGQPAYMYLFTQSVNSLTTVFFEGLKGENAPEFGTFHSSEIPFVFGNSSVLGNLYGERRDVSNIMMSYWANFARSGNPNGDGLPDWPAYDSSSRPYIELDTEFTTDYQLKQDLCDFWLNSGTLD